MTTKEEDEVEVELDENIEEWRTSHKKVNRDLQQSVHEDGLITSMTARRLPEGQNGKPRLKIIGGRERYKALKADGKRITLDMFRILDDISDVEAVVMAYAENAKRKNLTTIEEARAFQTMKKLGMTEDQIAEKVGLAKATIQNRIAALDLPKEIQQQIQKGTVAFSYAKTLLKLQNYPKAQKELSNKIAKSSKGGYYSEIDNVEDAETIVKKFFKRIAETKALVDKYGPCPKCGSNQIKEPSWGDENKLECEDCEYEWHKENKRPWHMIELENRAARDGLKIEWSEKVGKLSPQDEQEILNKQIEEEKEEKSLQPTFRSKVPISDVAIALVKNNVMSLDISGVNGDDLHIKLIEPSGIQAELFKKDYQRTAHVTKVTAIGSKNRLKVEQFLKSLQPPVSVVARLEQPVEA